MTFLPQVAQAACVHVACSRPWRGQAAHCHIGEGAGSRAADGVGNTSQKADPAGKGIPVAFREDAGLILALKKVGRH